jgi:hypothetical protein
LEVFLCQLWFLFIRLQEELVSTLPYLKDDFYKNHLLIYKYIIFMSIPKKLVFLISVLV